MNWKFGSTSGNWVFSSTNFEPMAEGNFIIQSAPAIMHRGSTYTLDCMNVNEAPSAASIEDQPLIVESYTENTIVIKVPENSLAGHGSNKTVSVTVGGVTQTYQTVLTPGVNKKFVTLVSPVGGVGTIYEGMTNLITDELLSPVEGAQVFSDTHSTPNESEKSYPLYIMEDGWPELREVGADRLDGTETFVFQYLVPGVAISNPVTITMADYISAISITGISSIRAGEIMTVTFEESVGGINSITINGVNCTEITATSSTVYTCRVPWSVGAAPGTTVDVVITSASDAIETASGVFLPPQNWSTVSASNVNSESVIKQTVDLTTISNGDIILYNPTVSPGNHTFTVNADTTFSHGENLPTGTYQVQVGFWDTSNGYQFSGIKTVSYAHENENPLPSVDEFSIEFEKPIRFYNSSGALVTQTGNASYAIFANGGTLNGNRIYTGTFTLTSEGRIPKIIREDIGPAGATVDVLIKFSNGKNIIIPRQVLLEG